MAKTSNKAIRVFLAGGGTGGPTAPVLAVAEELQKQKTKPELFFVGSSRGPERELLKQEQYKIHYLTIPAGKWRRYFSLWNLVDVLKIKLGFFKSLYLMYKYRPDVIFGAGSFVQVPLCWAGYLFGVPIIIHQQDLKVILSSRLVFPVAKKMTVAFEITSKEFLSGSGLFSKRSPSKVAVTGNPVRESIRGGSKAKAKEIFGLDDKHPTVLIMGGGGGSLALNKVALEAMPELVKYVQVIHLTGGKQGRGEDFSHPLYHPYDFLSSEMTHAYAAADLVISRAGMSAISELSALKKPAILVPLPSSPQLGNAYVLAMLHSALAVKQEHLTPELLVKLVRKVLWDSDTQKGLAENIGRLLPKNAAGKVARVIFGEVKNGR